MVADHGRITTKAAPPSSIAEHDGHSDVPGAGSPGHFIARSEQASQCRVRAENGEEVVGHDGLAEHEPAVAVGERVGENAPVRQAGGLAERMRLAA